MKNIEMKAIALGTNIELLLNSFQTYDEWKRQGKRVARGEKACIYIPMWRPFKVNKVVEKNGEKTTEETTLFHIQLVAIFHEAQLEGCEQKTLNNSLIKNVERFLKKHGLLNVNKEEYIKNVRAFEKRCKQYDDKIEEKKEVEELVEEPKTIEKKKTIEESRREFEEGAREIEKQLAEESIEEEKEEKEKEKEKEKELETEFDLRF